MIKQNNHRINYLGTAIFQVLLFICISTFNETSIKSNNNKSQYEIVSVHSPLSVLNDFPQLSFNNRLVSLINKENFKLFNQHFKLLADNRLLSQQYFFLQKAVLSIKAITSPGYNFHCLYTDTEEPPILS
jgi:hypothetical protein